MFSNFLKLLLIFSLSSKLSATTQSSEERALKNAGLGPQGTFERKQGLADIPDQLAIESSHDSHAVMPKYAQMPVPFAMKAFPGNIVLPMPPGFHQNKQQHSKVYQGPQGQFSQPQPSHQLPPKNFQPPPPHGKQLLGKIPQQHLILPQHQHLIRQPQLVQQQQPQQHQQQQIRLQGSHENKQQFLRPDLQPPAVHQQQQQQQQQIPYNQIQNQQPAKDQIANNILRELIERQKQNTNQYSTNHHNLNSLVQQQKPQQQQQNHYQQQQPQQQQKQQLPGHINKEIITSTNDLQAEGGAFPQPINEYGAPVLNDLAGPVDGGNGNAVLPGVWPDSPDGDMPKIAALEVKCEKNLMRVYIAFDKPFFGLIFSKGHYHNKHCIHLPAGLGHTSASFDITIDTCGTSGNMEAGLTSYGPPSGAGTFFENIIVIQYDSQVQEVWDQARKLRCTWHDQYEKSVTFRPFPVDMLDVVRADFAGDNVGCWMQIQVGKGPWASEVSGLVKIGQTMTMVLAIKDDENKFDMLVRNCMAHDGVKAPIQLVDQFGCITRPKLMSRFTKIKNFGASASVLSYAHFQAFKFPDSMEVHFQCTIQICRHQCPEQCQPPEAGVPGAAYGVVGKSGLPAEENSRRKRRSAASNETEGTEDEIIEFSTTFKIPSEDVGLNRIITVVSPNDLDFIQNDNKKENEQLDDEVPVIEASFGDVVCMSTFGFASMLVLLIGLLLISCIISAIIVIKRPRLHKY